MSMEQKPTQYTFDETRERIAILIQKAGLMGGMPKTKRLQDIYQSLSEQSSQEELLHALRSANAIING